MRSVELVLLQDFVRRGCRHFIVGTVGLAAVASLIYGAISLNVGGQSLGEDAVPLHFNFMLITGFCGVALAMSAQGRLPRFFQLPVSAPRLAGNAMLLGMAMVGLHYVLAAWIVNQTGADWPILGPTLFLMAIFAGMMAATWNFEGSTALQVLACGALSVLGFLWVGVRYGADWPGRWKSMWTEVSAAEIATMAAFAGAAYVAAAVGYGNVRRADAPSLARLAQWWERWLESWPVDWAPQQSKVAAQDWYMGRQTYPFRVSIGFYTAFFVVNVLVRLFGRGSSIRFRTDVVDAGAVILIVFPLVYGLIAATIGTSPKKGRMSEFHGTRPVTDSFLAWVILRTCGRAAFYAWLGWLGSILAAHLFLFLVDRPNSFTSDTQFGPLVAIGLLLIAWANTSVLATFLACGRVWPLMTLVILWCVGGPIYAILTPREHRLAVGHVFMLIEAATAPIFTVVFFVNARRLNLITNGMVVACSAIWLLLSVVGAWGYTQFPNRPIVELIFGIGTGTLLILPFAAMPLAIRWNRHR